MMKSLRLFRTIAMYVAASTLFAAPPAFAQDIQDPQAVLAATDWVTPPDQIAEAVLAPRYLNATLTNVSPDKRWFFHEIGDGPVTMDRFSKVFDELGGLFIDFNANRDRRLTIRTNIGIDIISAEDGAKVAVDIPDGARVSNATWSPDGSHIAFFVHTDEATHIYVADPSSGDSRQITRSPVLATLVTTFEWTGDGSEIATVLVPDGRSARPVQPRIPTGPQVKQTEDGENMLRTYASLMETPHDETLLEWHVTGQLATIEVDGRDVTEIGNLAMVFSFDFAPDGQHARVVQLERPFSFIVPVRSFGRVEQIWDRAGTMLTELEVTEMNTGLGDNRPAAPGVAGSGGDPDKREVAWREDGAGLTFLQQVSSDDEDDEDESPRGGRARSPDRVMLWAAPFAEGGATVVYESQSRMSGHRFSADHETLFYTERPGGGGRGGFGGGGASGTITHYAVDLGSDTQYTLAEYESDDFYANPGSLVMAGGRVAGGGRGGRGGGGGGVVQTSADGGSVFFYGTQYNEDPMVESPKTFVDKVEIRTGDIERTYESDNNGQFERITAVLDIDANRFVVSRESPTSIEQSYLSANGQMTQLTENIDYTPDLTNAPRQRFVVERPDGFRFLVNVTLPPDYTPGVRLPAMFWFYPREYEDQESYDERGRTYNMNAHPNFGTRSMQFLVRAGYAVVEPDAPIVGKQGQMNNNYEHDLRNNLAAVIDELDERGIIDRKRLGLGGHSYGAFGTVNAMVHTPFFKAGIAGDGNYNRTFTPLSFQSERRILWDAKDVYLGMSPFMFANNLTGALLMYHGLGDQNVGTAPDHSPRLFHALNGLGKEAAMYLYPFEDHGPATKETLLDLWGRWTAWLDVHLADEDLTITQQQDSSW
jgi:dipeptidyl aminopeptidase/acylaminoacyl peptidase